MFVPGMSVAGTGLSIPATAVSNSEVEKRLGLEPGWIARRTGIQSRPTAAANEATSDLAVEAGRQAFKRPVCGLPTFVFCYLRQAHRITCCRQAPGIGPRECVSRRARYGLRPHRRRDPAVTQSTRRFGR